MTYTSHGHHIPGSPEDFGDEPPKARCGGPGLCGICTSQSTAWKKEADRLGVLAELDEAQPSHEGLLIPLTYQSKVVNIKAIQFTGGAANGMDIVAWIKGFGGNATWRNELDPWESEDGQSHHPGSPEMLTIQTPDSRFLDAPVDWWIIQGTQGEFYPVSNDAFHEKYEEFKE